MEKVTCKFDKNVEVIIHDDGKVGCPNLDSSHAFRIGCWPCRITKEPCGYNGYEDDAATGALFDY